MENSKSRAIYITLIVLLLIGNGVFAYLYLSKEKEIVSVKEELVTTDNARKELDKLLKETEDQLSVYRGKNEELDSVIQAQSTELQAQAEKIRALLKDNRISAAQLLKVQDELDVMRWYSQKYGRQVDSLAKANEVLVADLQETKSDLNKAQSKIENLTIENIKKESQLAVASRLKTEFINVTGIQKRSSGRDRETTRASRVDQIRVELKIADNPTAEQGDKDIFLKIVSPEGATISTSASGGGSFSFMGEESLYTQRQRIKFKNEQPTITFSYARGSNQEWEKGTYKVELYAEGFLIGSKTFELN